MTLAAPTPAGNSLAFRAIQRQLEEALEHTQAGPDPAGPSLESKRLAPADPPRLARAESVEGTSLAKREVPGEPEEGFTAFLDGIQVSRVVLHEEAIPVVHGAVGAVIRERSDRRLGTWKHELGARIYAPRGFLSASTNAALDSIGLDVTDITPRKQGNVIDEDGRHPLALSDVAVSAVQAHRESLELRLAESWLDDRSEPLFVDGGISGSNRLAASDVAVGVIKSHRTLYGDPSAMRTILTLAEGERSTVFAVSSPNGWRSTVASWYLRLREGGDPLFGLVRVEIRMPSDSERTAVAARADQISRWILAEATPLSLPDSRWDTMSYGIRDCEQFLRSVLR